MTVVPKRYNNWQEFVNDIDNIIHTFKILHIEIYKAFHKSCTMFHITLQSSDATIILEENDIGVIVDGVGYNIIPNVTNDPTMTCAYAFKYLRLKMEEFSGMTFEEIAPAFTAKYM